MSSCSSCLDDDFQLPQLDMVHLTLPVKSQLTTLVWISFHGNNEYGVAVATHIVPQS